MHRADCKIFSLEFVGPDLQSIYLIRDKYISGWWQLKDFLFSPRSLEKWSNLTSIFFKWVETTNQIYIFVDHVMAARILTYFWRLFPTSTSLPTIEAVCRAMAFAENNNVTQKQILAGVYVGMISHPCGKWTFLNGISPFLQEKWSHSRFQLSLLRKGHRPVYNTHLFG